MRIVSFYQYLFGQSDGPNFNEQYKNWENAIELNSQELQCKTFTNNMFDEELGFPSLSLVKDFQTNKTYAFIIECLKIEQEWYISHGIKMKFSLSFFHSLRQRDKNRKLTIEEKKGIVVNFCCTTQDQWLVLDSFIIWKSPNNLRKYFISQRKKTIKRLHTPVLEELPAIRYICLSGKASSILVHEVFGHVFEENNYHYIFKEKQVIIPSYIHVIDSPATNLCGYCVFDDEGNDLAPITIIEDGNVCNLLRTNHNIISDEYVTNSRGRLGLGGQKLLPRMTNTILLTSYAKKHRW